MTHISITSPTVWQNSNKWALQLELDFVSLCFPNRETKIIALTLLFLLRILKIMWLPFSGLSWEWNKIGMYILNKWRTLRKCEFTFPLSQLSFGHAKRIHGGNDILKQWLKGNRSIQLARFLEVLPMIVYWILDRATAQGLLTTCQHFNRLCPSRIRSCFSHYVFRAYHNALYIWMCTMVHILDQWVGWRRLWTALSFWLTMNESLSNYLHMNYSKHLLDHLFDANCSPKCMKIPQSHKVTKMSITWSL